MFGVFGGGVSKQIANVLLQIQQLRADLLPEAGHGSGHEAPHNHGHGHGEHGIADAHHHNHHRLSIQQDTIPIFHLIVDCFNLLGVSVIVVCTLGILPTLFFSIFPRAFNLHDTGKMHGRMLECRLQLSRGLILGMDLMVASDIVETLCGQVDLVKLVVIVIVRSWLGWERNQEMSHMTHEYHAYQKTQVALHSHLGNDITKDNLVAKINQTFEALDSDHNGRISSDELKSAFKMCGAKVTDSELSAVATMKGLDKKQFAKMLRSMTFIQERVSAKDLDKVVKTIEEQMKHDEPHGPAGGAHSKGAHVKHEDHAHSSAH